MGRRRRPAIAAILALAVAGLGHVYLRRWGRAVAWFLTIVATGTVLIATFASPDAGVRELPLTVLVPVGCLFVLSAVDAYLLASRSAAPERADEAQTVADERFQCPNCGREVDPELDFCHWCTRRLSSDAESDGTPESSSGREGD